MIVQSFDTLGDAWCPGCCVAKYRCAPDASAVACEAGRVVYLRSRHCGCNGLWLNGGFDNRSRRFSFLARHIDLAERSNTSIDGGPVFFGFAGIHALTHIQHVHRQYDNDQRHHDGADND